MSEGWLGVLAVLLLAAFQGFFVCLVLLRPPNRQSSALAWILVILVVPAVGAFAYLLFGDVHLGSRLIRRRRDIARRIRAQLADHWATSKATSIEEGYQSIANLAYHVGQTEPHGGNVLDLMAETDDVVASLSRDVESAKEYCHLLYYIYLADESGQKIGGALRRAARRGVRCRLLVDAVGSSQFLGSPLRREIEEDGVEIVAALPVKLASLARIDLRNHRKIAVFDGEIGYTGSHNLANADFAVKPAFAPWVDATVRIQGPAVRDLHELFIEDWYAETSESLEELLAREAPWEEAGVPVQVIGTGPNCRNDALIQFIQAAFHLAREELILTTPYFVPDEGTRDAMATAALRGVETTLVVPKRNDSRLVGAASRSYYEPLLDAGVEIFEYQKGLLHTKTVTVDRGAALVSTANLDRRSFELNFEVSLAVYDSDFASRLRLLQRTYLESSEKIEPIRWGRRSRLMRIGHNAAGMLAPLL